MNPLAPLADAAKRKIQNAVVQGIIISVVISYFLRKIP